MDAAAGSYDLEGNCDPRNHEGSNTFLSFKANNRLISKLKEPALANDVHNNVPYIEFLSSSDARIVAGAEEYHLKYTDIQETVN